MAAKNINSIGDYAFYCCSKLTGNLIIPSGVISIGSYAFYCCGGLKGKLVIPQYVTSIGNYTFTGCTKLTGNLTLPPKISFIGEWTFQSCGGLTGNIVIPPKVTHIGFKAFSNCNFNSFEFSGSNAEYRSEQGVLLSDNGKKLLFYPSRKEGNIYFPPSVTFIEGFSFCKLIGFKGSLVIPDSILHIDDHAFYYCNFVGNLVIPKKR